MNIRLINCQIYCYKYFNLDVCTNKYPRICFHDQYIILIFAFFDRKLIFKKHGLIISKESSSDKVIDLAHFSSGHISKTMIALIKKKSQKNLTNFHLLYYEIIQILMAPNFKKGLGSFGDWA